MTYQYKCKVTAGDFFRLSMRQTYHSMAGMCNLVFTVAMILLAAKFWNQSSDILQVLMLLGCLLFPVIQPIAVYMKAKGQAAAMPSDVELVFDDGGVRVTAGDKQQKLRWSELRVARQPNMIIVFSDARHGYMLTNRVLGKEKDAFFAFAESKIEQGK